MQRLRARLEGEGDVLAQEAEQQVLHVADRVVEVEDARALRLPPREGQQLLGEGLGALPRVLDLAQGGHVAEAILLEVDDAMLERLLARLGTDR